MIKLIQLGQFYIITHFNAKFFLIIDYLTYLTFLVNLHNQLLQSTFLINLY